MKLFYIHYTLHISSESRLNIFFCLFHWRWKWEAKRAWNLFYFLLSSSIQIRVINMQDKTKNFPFSFVSHNKCMYDFSLCEERISLWHCAESDNVTLAIISFTSLTHFLRPKKFTLCVSHIHFFFLFCLFWSYPLLYFIIFYSHIYLNYHFVLRLLMLTKMKVRVFLGFYFILFIFESVLCKTSMTHNTSHISFKSFF